MDCRLRSGLPSWATFDEGNMTISFSHDTGEEEPREIVLRAVYIVCPTCKGTGSHVNPSVDMNGLSQEDFDDDPGFREDYFGGVYDVTCNTCGGKRVIPEPADNNDEQDLMLYENAVDEDMVDARTVAREMGWMI